MLKKIPRYWRLVLQRNIYGIDISGVAVKRTKARLPRAKIIVKDINKINYPENFFDIVIMMEVLEHLEKPEEVLFKLNTILKKGGYLAISFPNYLNIPWFMIRILSEYLNKPGWIALQPVDKIFTIFGVIKRVRRCKFKLIHVVGSTYFPPKIYEPLFFTQFANKIGLSYISFHPILIFQKTNS